MTICRGSDKTPLVEFGTRVYRFCHVRELYSILLSATLYVSVYNFKFDHATTASVTYCVSVFTMAPKTKTAVARKQNTRRHEEDDVVLRERSSGPVVVDSARALADAIVLNSNMGAATCWGDLQQKYSMFFTNVYVLDA